MRPIQPQAAGNLRATVQPRPQPEKDTHMRIKTTMTALATAALLLGCRVHSQHEVFVSDLRDVAGGAQASVEMQSTFRVPLPTKGDCQKYQPRIVAIFARYHDEVSPGECVPAGNTVELTFTAKARVVRASTAPIPGSNVFALAVEPGERPGTIHLFAVTDAVRLGQLQAEIRAMDFDASRETITFDQVTLILNNDTNGVVQVRAPSAFVNREPALVVGVDLARRGRLELRLSDVAVTQITRRNWTLVVSLN
jgi:hypothetical protein